MMSKPKALPPLRGTLLILAGVVGAWLPTLAGGQTAGDQASVFASGNVRYAYLPCSLHSCDGAFGDPIRNRKAHWAATGRRSLAAWWRWAAAGRVMTHGR